MTQDQQERAKILLQAALDILEKCSETMYVRDVFEVTAIWDEAECDGYCLKDDIEILINEIK